MASCFWSLHESHEPLLIKNLFLSCSYVSGVSPSGLCVFQHDVNDCYSLPSYSSLPGILPVNDIRFKDSRVLEKL